MASSSIPFTSIVRNLPETIPFVGPEELERRRGAGFRARIGANESRFGVSPKAREAMRAAVDDIPLYADSAGHDLRAALAAKHRVEPDEICIGAGIDAILGNVVRMVIEPGQPVVTSDGAYPTFNYHVNGFGGRLEKVPYRDDREDPDALLARAGEVASPLLYFCNPDNPMGTWYPAERVQRLIDAVPDGSLLVLDEAYIDFAPDGTAPAMDPSDPRVIRMRTFSKAHGMAGARIGYCVGHKDLITGLNKVRNHFEINRIAQVGALASLHDPEFIAGVVTEVARGREEYAELARRLGLASLPSATNFVAIDVGGGDRARGILKQLEAEGVFIRMPGVAPLDRCIRVTVGHPEERKAFAETLERVLERVPLDA